MFKILAEISARHINLEKKHFEILFGSEEKLKSIRNISQPGEFAAEQTLILKTPKADIKRVRIVGPLREQTQVEISKTDARNLGLNPPIRISGNLNKSEKGELIGPIGKVDLFQGIIIAQRHLHLDSETALKNNLKNQEIVSVRIGSKNRLTTFHQVVVRVSSKFKNSFHLDTDESNAAGLIGGEEGIVIKNNE